MHLSSTQPDPSTSLLRDSNLHVVFCVTLVGVLGVASITPAFPRIIATLKVSPVEVGLLITVFTLPGIFLAPMLGVLADRYGRKQILVPSLLLFGIAGFSCSLTRDFTLLLGLRFFQGVGAAALGALNVTVIGDLFSGQQRTTAMGYNASVLSIGAATYPVIGGALASIAWFYPFYLPLAAIPVGLIVLFVLDLPATRTDQRLSEYLSEAWKSIREPQVLGLFLISTTSFIVLYGSYLAYFPILINHRFGQPSFVIGLIMASTSFATVLTSSQLGRLSRRFSRRNLLLTSAVFYASGLFLIPFIPRLLLLLIPTFLFGIGQGLGNPVVQTLLADLAPKAHRAAIMSFNGTVLRLGQTLGPLITGIAYTRTGINGVFLTGSALALILPVIIFLMGVGRKVPVS